MAITRLNSDLDIISKVDTRPNDNAGWTAEQVKAEFDKAGNLIKAYLNTVLLPFLEGSAGAESIGLSAIPGLTGVQDVQTALESIIEQMQDISQGAVADGSITSEKLAAGAVGDGKLAANAVDTGNLKAGAVTGEKIAQGVVDATKIAALAVLTEKLADLCVTTAKLGNKSVTTAKIADAAVGSTQLDAYSVTEGKISNGAVTANKLGSNAVTNTKINAGAVTEEKIGNGAVTEGKIANAAVTPAKLSKTYAELTDGKVAPSQASSDIFEITGSRTLELGHAGKLGKCTNSSAATVTIPTHSSVAFPIGTEIEFVRLGAGTVTFSSSATIRSAGSKKKIATQYNMACIKKLAENEWLLVGDLG